MQTLHNEYYVSLSTWFNYIEYREYIDPSTELFTDDTKPNQEYNIIHIKRTILFYLIQKAHFIQ
jgi:hypothetical protein